MPVKDTPVFTQKPIVAKAIITAANTNRYTPTVANLVELVASDGAALGGAEGALVYLLEALPRDTLASASQIQLYSTMVSGTPAASDLTLIDTALMAAHSVASTTEIPVTSFGYSEAVPRRLAAGERWFLGSAGALANGIACRAELERF